MKHIFLLISLLLAACSSSQLKKTAYQILQQNSDCNRNERISNSDLDGEICQDYDAYQAERKRYLSDKPDKD